MLQIDALNDRIGLLRNLLQFGFIMVINDRVEFLHQRTLTLLQEVLFFKRRFATERADHGHLEVFEIFRLPSVGHECFAYVMNHLGNIDGQAVAEEGVAAFAVNRGTLLVHHVIVFQQTLTDAEVVFLDFLLGAFDGLGNHAVLDHIAVLVAHAVHDFRDTVGAEQTHEVVLQRDEELGAAGIALTAGTTTQLTVNAAGVVAFRADDGQTAFLTNFRCQLDIGTTTGHVGGNGDGAFATGFCHNVSLLLVQLGVQDIMFNMSAGQDVGKQLRDFNRGGTHQHGSAHFMQPQNLIHYSGIFLTFGLIDQVIGIHTDNRLVGRNHHDIEFVDVPELARFRFSGTGHAGQLFVHAEVVLQGDGGIRLCGSLHLHIFLRLDSLVQPVGVAAALHDTASLLIHNLHLVVDDDVFHIFVEHGVGFQQLMDSVDTVGSDSVVVIDFLFAGQLFVRSEVFLLQFGDLGTHIGHDEHLGLVGVFADEVDTLVHNINCVELLFDHEIEFVINEVHIAVLVLHEEGFRALQHLFHAGFAQELDERLVLRQTAVGAEQQHGAFVLRFRVGILGQHLLGLREDMRHVGALGLIQLLHDGFVLVEGLLVAFGRGTGDNQRSTGIVN